MYHACTMLYHACKNDNADFAQLLFDHGANKPTFQRSILGTLLNDVTLLDRAINRQYDPRIIDIILRVNPSLCTFRNNVNQFPVETILKAKKESGYLYEDLPFDLMSRMLEAMSPSLIEETTSKNDISTSNLLIQQRYNDFRILASALKKQRAVRSINVHLIGDGFAGKTTIRLHSDTLYEIQAMCTHS